MINYRIKAETKKREIKKYWEPSRGYSCETGISWNGGGMACFINASPVTFVKVTDYVRVENPVLPKLRKKFKQAKIKIVERAFHVDGVPYVELRAA